MTQPTEGICYLDTSALAKFYLTEPGSKTMVRWFGPRASGFRPVLPLYTSSLGYPETLSAITRRRNVGGLSANNALQAWRRIVLDFAAPEPPYTFVKADERVVAQAALLVITHGLRAYDAVHLASAMTLRNDLRNSVTLTFVTCDIRLKHAAVAENLVVADPTV